MSATHQLDILRPLRRDEIEKMVEICAQNLPMSIRGYNFLRMNLKLSENFAKNPNEYTKLVISDYIRRDIYTKRDGKVENCTFISISGPKDYNLFIYSNDENELRECLMKTNLIDYSLGPFFISFEGRHRHILTDVFNYHKAEIAVENKNSGRVLSKANAKNLEYEHEIPDDVVLESLQIDDAYAIDSVWPHRYPGSVEYLKSLIGINDTVGVFSKDGRQIRSWALLNEQFGPGMVQTIAEHRGKGYAKLVIKALSKIIATKYDLDVLAFIMRGNKASERTFEKLEFSIIPMENDYSWIFMKKQQG